MEPTAMGATEHIHRTISESFYVLSGDLRLYNGERWVTASDGDFRDAPPGGLHAFQNDGDDPVSFLLVFTPKSSKGALRESGGVLAAPPRRVDSIPDQARPVQFHQHWPTKLMCRASRGEACDVLVPDGRGPRHRAARRRRPGSAWSTERRHGACDPNQPAGPAVCLYRWPGRRGASRGARR
ncbi:cupin domain-containing protein [Nocardia sp. NPDC049220]|uniref:cupin domain-containing protein n=1 Tax=Nocardia sp. NPDC049220 TaxID=3155273 RepID=UPI0033DC46C4